MDSDEKNFGGIDAAIWAQLEEAALAVRANAYAPYSDFPVGAAFMTAEGDIIVGCNVENATFGATSCAERTAIGTAVAQGKKNLIALCVITNVDEPSAPCGICRQVLSEFCEDLPIMMANTAGTRRYTTLDTLLPLRFSKTDFKS